MKKAGFWVAVTILLGAGGSLWLPRATPQGQISDTKRASTNGATVTSNAHEVIKSCGGVDVSSMIVSTEFDRGMSFLPDPSPKINTESSGEVEPLLLLGPPLGSMDSK